MGGPGRLKPLPVRLPERCFAAKVTGVVMAAPADSNNFTKELRCMGLCFWDYGNKINLSFF